jgi:hypothetical protein
MVVHSMGVAQICITRVWFKHTRYRLAPPLSAAAVHVLWLAHSPSRLRRRLWHLQGAEVVSMGLRENYELTAAVRERFGGASQPSPQAPPVHTRTPAEPPLPLASVPAPCMHQATVLRLAGADWARSFKWWDAGSLARFIDGIDGLLLVQRGEIMAATEVKDIIRNKLISDDSGSGCGSGSDSGRGCGSGSGSGSGCGSGSVGNHSGGIQRNCGGDKRDGGSNSNVGGDDNRGPPAAATSTAAGGSATSTAAGGSAATSTAAVGGGGGGGGDDGGGAGELQYRSAEAVAAIVDVLQVAMLDAPEARGLSSSQVSQLLVDSRHASSLPAHVGGMFTPELLAAVQARLPELQAYAEDHLRGILAAAATVTSTPTSASDPTLSSPPTSITPNQATVAASKL